jgi:hypothetical protein
MTTDQRSGAELYRLWASMWNGNLDVAEQIIAERFVAHLTADAVEPPEHLCDARTVASWVAHIRGRGIDMTYSVEVGPLVDADLVVGYWRLSGFRPTNDGPPLPFEKVGIDILRYRTGRITECWTMNNMAARRA